MIVSAIAVREGLVPPRTTPRIDGIGKEIKPCEDSASGIHNSQEMLQVMT
jgi:hypothetical protein